MNDVDPDLKYQCYRGGGHELPAARCRRASAPVPPGRPGLLKRHRSRVTGKSKGILGQGLAESFDCDIYALHGLQASPF